MYEFLYQVMMTRTVTTLAMMIFNDNGLTEIAQSTAFAYALMYTASVKCSPCLLFTHAIRGLCLVHLMHPSCIFTYALYINESYISNHSISTLL
jgi:hypothetical protein